MEQCQKTPTGKDPHLWQLAQRRATFKSHFSTYLIFSAFFWVQWALTVGAQYNPELPWPVWPMLGWGIGVLFHYMSAYGSLINNSAEREYEKLTKQKSEPQTF